MSQSGGKKAVIKTDGKTAADSNEEGFCPQCSKTVKGSDSALCCEICDQWYHIKCQDISESEYKFLAEHN